jgi:hypothetical protein
VSLYKTLAEIGLSGLWSYIGQISNAIWSEASINNNQWFLDENEQQILLDNILLSLWKDPIGRKTNMKEYINTYKNNHSNLWTFTNNAFKKWNSHIEEEFLDKFALNQKFNLIKFRESIT